MTMSQQKNDAGKTAAASLLLPLQELRGFVENYFSRREVYLNCFSGREGPLYVLEPDVLIHRAEAFKQAFQAVLPGAGFYFAVKSNNHPDVSRTLLKTGFGLDVSSGPELRLALDLQAEAIVFSGPGKTDAELMLAVENSDQVIVLLDSFGELRRLEDVAASRRKIMRAGVRLTTNPEGLWRKFGIPSEQLPGFREAAGRCAHVSLQGIQFHTSWNMTPDAQTAFIRRLGDLLSNMPGDFIRCLTFIDIGGGYWPEQGEWLHSPGTGADNDQGPSLPATPADTLNPHYRLSADPISVFARKIGSAVHHAIFPLTTCRIFFEPGRWICNNAMQLMLRVVDKKAKDLVITDAGTNAVGWERFETDYCPILNLTRPSLSERPCHILGSLCTPHDVWGYSYFGEGIDIGDVLMIPAQGAYTYSLRQSFIKSLPTVLTMPATAS